MSCVHPEQRPRYTSAQAAMPPFVMFALLYMTAVFLELSERWTHPLFTAAMLGLITVLVLTHITRVTFLIFLTVTTAHFLWVQFPEVANHVNLLIYCNILMISGIIYSLVVEKGKLYPHAEAAGVADIKTLADFCERSPGIILKQSDGRAGMGVIGLSVEQGGWRVNGKEASADAVEKLIARLDNYLVTARVPQAAYAASIFPHVANSVRIVTMQDLARNSEPFIAVAYQKFGSHASVPTDNWSAGGFRSEIDLETGELGPAIKKYLKRKSQHVFYEQHPETGGQIAGVLLPGWAELQAQLLATLGELSFLRLVGWDVLVQDDGFCILEGNTRPSLISLQATRPILGDPRARKFLTHHGIVGS